MTFTGERPPVRWWWPIVADLVCVLALAIGGKGAHEASDTNWVVLAIAWPFAVAASVAHVWLVGRGRPTRRTWPEGVIVLGMTYVLGMLLRAVSGRDLAPAFLIVAGLFLALTMLGWRAVVHLMTRHHGRRTSQSRRTTDGNV